MRTIAAPRTCPSVRRNRRASTQGAQLSESDEFRSFAIAMIQPALNPRQSSNPADTYTNMRRRKGDGGEGSASQSFSDVVKKLICDSRSCVP